MKHDEQRTVNDNGDTVKHKETEQQQAAQWSKISTQKKNGLLLKNAAQIFRATAENWISSTRRATHTAHSKHSKRSYALFYALRIATQQHSTTNSVQGFLQRLCLWLFDYG